MQKTDGLLIGVLGYAKVVVLRAEIRFGSEPKARLADFCERDTALRERLLHSYNLESRKTGVDLLGFPSFIGSMRAQSLRRLACTAKLMHERRREDKSITPRNRSRLEWGDNPNAYVQLSQFLINAAEINAEQARHGTTVSPEQAAVAANTARLEFESSRLARRRPRLRPSAR